MMAAFAWRRSYFNPRPPRGGRLWDSSGRGGRRYFNPRPPRGGRRICVRRQRPPLNFNPRPPRGGRRYAEFLDEYETHISIHAPREGGDVALAHPDAALLSISIHAPREGGDSISLALRQLIAISIHAPREGGDYSCTAWHDPPFEFQSTPPARGATRGGLGHDPDVGISIHAPREGGDWVHPEGRFAVVISIHAPREGGDSKDAQFYLRIFDKQVELLRFLGKIRGWLPEKPGERPAFSREKPCEPPSNLWSLGLRGGGKARPGYPCAVPLPRRAACVRGSGDPPADRCSSYRNAPLFSHIASPGSKSADCLSQDP